MKVYPNLHREPVAVWRNVPAESTRDGACIRQGRRVASLAKLKANRGAYRHGEQVLRAMAGR